MQKLLVQAEVGLHMIDIPERFGGLELDKTTSCLVSEASTQQESFSVAVGAHNGIGMLPLVFYETKSSNRWLPKFATAEVIGAYALTETGSGSDALGAKTTAVLSEDGKEYIINGSKMWITNAGIADVFTISLKSTVRSLRAFGSCKHTGLSIGAEEHKMGIKVFNLRPRV